MAKLKYSGLPKDISNKTQDISKEPENYFVDDKMRKTKSPFAEPEEAKEKTYQQYLKMKNPDTGERYNIPMLSLKSPDYENQYVKYMKLKELNPDVFNKIISWE